MGVHLEVHVCGTHVHALWRPEVYVRYIFQSPPIHVCAICVWGCRHMNTTVYKWRSEYNSGVGSCLLEAGSLLFLLLCQSLQVGLSASPFPFLTVVNNLHRCTSNSGVGHKSYPSVCPELIAELCGNSVFNLLTNLGTYFYNELNTLPFHQYWMRIPFPHTIVVIYCVYSLDFNHSKGCYGVSKY